MGEDQFVPIAVLDLCICVSTSLLQGQNTEIFLKIVQVLTEVKAKYPYLWKE